MASMWFYKKLLHYPKIASFQVRYFCGKSIFDQVNIWSDAANSWHKWVPLCLQNDFSFSLQGRRNFKNLWTKEERQEFILMSLYAPAVLLLAFLPWDWGQYAPRMGNELMMIILVISSRSDPQWGLIFHQVISKLKPFDILLSFFLHCCFNKFRIYQHISNSISEMIWTHCAICATPPNNDHAAAPVFSYT